MQHLNLKKLQNMLKNFYHLSLNLKNMPLKVKFLHQMLLMMPQQQMQFVYGQKFRNIVRFRAGGENLPPESIIFAKIFM